MTGASVSVADGLRVVHEGDVGPGAGDAGAALHQGVSQTPAQVHHNQRFHVFFESSWSVLEIFQTFQWECIAVDLCQRQLFSLQQDLLASNRSSRM